MLFAAAGLTFAVGARLSHDRDVQSAQAGVTPAVSVATLAEAPPHIASSTAAASPLVPLPPPQSSVGVDLRADASLPQDGPLRPDDKVPAGQGMLEVVAGSSENVYIDGALIGTGPVATRALAPRAEPYEVRVKSHGEDRIRFALVKAARLTRVRLSPPWSR
jgi:hypothetical protein